MPKNTKNTRLKIEFNYLIFTQLFKKKYNFKLLIINILR